MKILQTNKILKVFLFTFIVSLLIFFNARTIPLFLVNIFVYPVLVSLLIFIIDKIRIKKYSHIILPSIIFTLCFGGMLTLFVKAVVFKCTSIQFSVDQNIFTGECRNFNETGLCDDKISPWYYRKGCDDVDMNNMLERNQL